jgi:hypothetical protein
VVALVGVPRVRTWRGLRACLRQAGGRRYSGIAYLSGLSDDGTLPPAVFRGSFRVSQGLYRAAKPFRLPRR